jgi:hypothetical protein
VILVVVGTIVGGQPGNGDVVPFFVENRARVLNQSLLFGLASVLFLWFLGTLRQHLASAGGSAVRFSSVAFAGGIVTLGMLLLSGTVVTALADGVARHAPEDVTRALYSLTVQASDLTSFGAATCSSPASPSFSARAGTPQAQGPERCSVPAGHRRELRGDGRSVGPEARTFFRTGSFGTHPQPPDSDRRQTELKLDRDHVQSIDLPTDSTH